MSDLKQIYRSTFHTESHKHRLQLPAKQVFSGNIYKDPLALFPLVVSIRRIQRNSKMATPIQTGSSLAGTSVSAMSQSMNTHRTCTVEITNHTGVTLFDPNHHCHSGYCHTPLQPVIAPKTREAFGFSKNSEAPTGCVGVFTYRLENSSLRFAVMFSVPYDCNLYENWFGLAFLDAGDVADEALYNNMYNSKEFHDRTDRKRAKAKSGITLHIESEGWKISATMSEAKKAIIHLEVTSTHQQNAAPYPFQPYSYS